MTAIRNITFACENPVELAEFWAAATGYAPLDVPPAVQEAVDAAIAAGELDPTGWAMLVPPAGDGPRLLFQRRVKTPADSSAIHLDLAAEDREAEVKRLAALGATVVDTRSRTIGPYTETWTVLRDPEGNGFCIQ